MNTISDLWNGRSGLARTYWLWGVLSGIPWGVALSLVTPGSNLAIFVLLAFFAYYVIVHVGIWRAASEYEGAKAWAILAKIAVAITPVCLAIGTLAAVIIPATHQSPKQVQSLDINKNPIQSATEPPGEIDFFLLMAAPHESEVSRYNKILKAHPDAVTISESKDFKIWVLNNPKTWGAIKSHDADGMIAAFSEFKSRH